MSEKLKTGDYVRITIEGEFRAKDLSHLKETGTYAPDERNWELLTNETDTIVVEKIEPPVEVFKPGDRVRDKVATDYHFLVLNKGYVDLTNNIYNEDDYKFTSGHFERVE